MKLRYMTPKEEEFWTSGVAGTIDREEILLRKSGRTIPEIAHTIRHEIGHMRYPISESLKSEYEVLSPEFDVDYLFSELLANYYALTIDPNDRNSKSLIYFEKYWARKRGLSKSQIDRLDKLARETVGYG